MDNGRKNTRPPRPPRQRKGANLNIWIDPAIGQRLMAYLSAPSSALHVNRTTLVEAALDRLLAELGYPA